MNDVEALAILQDAVDCVQSEHQTRRNIAPHAKHQEALAYVSGRLRNAVSSGDALDALVEIKRSVGLITFKPKPND